jgi:hypothetical protein
MIPCQMDCKSSSSSSVASSSPKTVSSELTIMFTEPAVSKSVAAGVRSKLTIPSRNDCDCWRSMLCQLFEKPCLGRTRTENSSIRLSVVSLIEILSSVIPQCWLVCTSCADAGISLLVLSSPSNFFSFLSISCTISSVCGL